MADDLGPTLPMPGETPSTTEGSDEQVVEMGRDYEDDVEDEEEGAGADRQDAAQAVSPVPEGGITEPLWQDDPLSAEYTNRGTREGTVPPVPPVGL